MQQKIELPGGQRELLLPVNLPRRVLAPIIMAAGLGICLICGVVPRAEGQLPAISQPAPVFNQVAYKATHNSYWVKRDNIVEAGASGTEERTIDQLAFEGVRSLEWDIHRDDTHAHQFTIYHTDRGGNSMCLTLDECLKQLVVFQRAAPQHDPITIVLELKETGIGSPFNDTHTPQDLDTTLEKYLGAWIYRPRDLLARCGAEPTVRSCLKVKGWPTIPELRGKYLVALIGNHNGVAGPADSACGPHSIDNRGAWVYYANLPGGIAARSAFLMESPWATGSIACQTKYTPQQVATAVAAAAFVQLETTSRSSFTCNAASPDCPRSWAAANLVVRVDYGKDDKPTLDDQAAAIQAGMGLIQNDHPWNAWNDGAPLRPGTLIAATPNATGFGVFNQLTQATRTNPLGDLTLKPGGASGSAARAILGTLNALGQSPIHPELTLNEPGHRIYAKILQEGDRALIPQRFAFGVPPVTQWETLVAVTRPATNSDFPNPRRPRGIGCIFAEATPDATGKPAFGARICRGTVDGSFSVQKPVGEDVRVTVEIIQNHVSTTSTAYSDNNDSGGAGELISLDVSGGGPNANTCIIASSSGEVTGGSPAWKVLKKACFPAQLTQQGLSAEHGDVVFTGTKWSFANAPGAPPAVTNYFEPFDSRTSGHVISNLTWPPVR